MIPEGYKQTKAGIIPEDWISEKIQNATTKIRKPVKVDSQQVYQEIGIRSHGKGLFHKESTTGKELGDKSVFWIEPDCLILNIVFAWEQAVAKTTENEKGLIASHRFPMFKAKEKKADVDYLLYFFKSKRGKHFLGLASPGGAGRNKTLGQNEFANLLIPLPPLQEQEKIAEILETWDSAIATLQSLITEKERLKKGLVQKLLSGEIRLPGFEGKWEYTKLGDLLDYEQPTRYLVSSTTYDDKYETPVLTAGKTFILGYTNEEDGIFNEDLPVIIFDDFTTASQFVDFPFKAKSSAMKILKARNSYVNIKIVFELMQMIRFTADDHKRYWISEYQEFDIKLPPLPEQQKITEILSAADAEIARLKTQLDSYREQKKGLMQQLLTGKTRVKV